MSYYRAENILPLCSLTALKDYVCTASDRFESANVIPYRPGFRMATVLHSPILPEGIASIIEKHIGLAAIALDLPNCSISETQITRTPNGGYFKKHTDNTVNKERVLSYVFYFGGPVAGGELCLEFPENPVTIAPCNNSIVVFPSDVPHEVLPVVCGDGFMAARFTVNGWISQL